MASSNDSLLLQIMSFCNLQVDREDNDSEYDPDSEVFDEESSIRTRITDWPETLSRDDSMRR